MSHIKNIEIKNFKSIRHATIEDCRRVNVFIGYPNVGKSNILEAMGGYSLLNRKAFHTKSLKSLIRFTRFTDIFFNGDTVNPATIEINGEDNLIYQLSDLESLNLFISGLGDETKTKDGKVAIRKGLMYLKSKINKDGSFLYSEGMDVEHTGKVLIKKYSFGHNSKFESSKSLNLDIPSGENLNDIVEVNSELRKECNEILKQYGLNLHFDRTDSGNKLELRKSLSDGTTITLDWNLIADTLQRLFFLQSCHLK